MLRAVGGAIRAGVQVLKTVEPFRGNFSSVNQLRYFSFSTQKCSLPTMSTNKSITTGEFLVKLLQPYQPTQMAQRNLIKFSMKKGKRKAVKTVLKRFKRLHWGGWIRTIAGRSRYYWQKSKLQRKRCASHVCVNGKQAWLLDTMTTEFWRRPKYYVDDPYTPYHTREFLHHNLKPINWKTKP